MFQAQDVLERMRTSLETFDTHWWAWFGLRSNDRRVIPTTFEAGVRSIRNLLWYESVFSRRIGIERKMTCLVW